MSDLVSTVVAARKAGLFLDREGDRLIVRGDRRHEHLVRSLLARKAEVFGLLDVYNGRATLLVWKAATVPGTTGRCGICGGRALLREPYEGRPMHKTCAETAIGVTAEQAPIEEKRAPEKAAAGRPVLMDVPCCGERSPGIADEPLKLSCQLCPKSPTYWRRFE